MGCQTFNNRVFWKAMVKTSITSLLQKTDNYGTIERKSGKHNNDIIVTSQSIAVNK